MNKIAVRNIERAPADIIARLAKSGVATVHEAFGQHGLMDPRIRPIQCGARIAGSAVTALCTSGDNWMLHVAIEFLQPGDILVLATSSHCDDGYFGDLLATACKVRGAAGVVLGTGVRDVSDLRALGFPVWSRGVSAQGTIKETVGAANVPVVCGGVNVVPGDIVIADDDGVVVIPREDGACVLEGALAREGKEIGIRERLEAGEGTLDLLNLRAKLEKKGLRYVDGPIDWRKSVNCI